MGFGVLEPKSSRGSAGTYIPGTAPLYDKAPHRADAKHDGSDSSLILVPQPTDDPNDPLVSRRTSYLRQRIQHGDPTPRIRAVASANAWSLLMRGVHH